MDLFDTLAAQVTAQETTPFLAAEDERTYCEAILPLDAPADQSYPEDEAPGQEPIPGHPHEFDAGFWG